MQHKSRFSRIGLLFTAFLGLSAAVLLFIAVKDIPAPARLIETPLDVKPL